MDDSDAGPTGQSDLALLLESMRPRMDESMYVFRSIAEAELAGLPFLPLSVFREAEGVTVVVTRAQAADQGWPPEPGWARITLTVHSSLLAVGFLAAVTGALAREGISVNPISAFFHDHLFVPWESRRDAMRILQALRRPAE